MCVRGALVKDNKTGERKGLFKVPVHKERAERIMEKREKGKRKGKSMEIMEVMKNEKNNIAKESRQNEEWKVR